MKHTTWLIGLRLLGHLITVGVVALLAAAVLGHALRDRVAAMAVLSYLPLLFVALGAAAWDLVRRGRALGRGRFVLAAVGVVAAVWALAGMVGWRAAEPAPGDAESIRVLQWNVQWGARHGPAAAWNEMIETIADARADVIVLSEAPADEGLAPLLARLGPGWSAAGAEHEAGERYWYRLRVLGPAGVRLVAEHALPGGVAVVAEVDGVERVEGGAPLRVMVVDAVSRPWRDRRPTMRAAASLVEAAAARGEPIDVIAGDFNAPSRSVSLDGLRDAGYRLASEARGSWRATWPTWLPWLELDHVWLAPHAALHGRETLANRWADHHGQVVRLSLGGRAAARSGDPPRAHQPRP